mmetsp:Transcript_3642/g.5381  ORF Transcript_3642/g.5381 Transcript_3642/m.5381 type:complete len:211 (-) Transcript_3642:74-706(-)|eukprot:CAMPEP_0117428514 /NCGR_PEP_ID=MMETSP0758-20121206/8200_1 /TAXON_ID=63605 /ORGANISM="Percolomonas cosmopolitus, Strain AE-1 (ATCC 50343)" /LENGTH=210 /DNA_ID=CAMNT_0005214903 /DNA_START=53 /DNA_END=685 /DNA_ORIENTATION=-
MLSLRHPFMRQSLFFNEDPMERFMNSFYTPRCSYVIQRRVPKIVKPSIYLDERDEEKIRILATMGSYAQSKLSLNLNEEATHVTIKATPEENTMEPFEITLTLPKNMNVEELKSSYDVEKKLLTIEAPKLKSRSIPILIKQDDSNEQKEEEKEDENVKDDDKEEEDEEVILDIEGIHKSNEASTTSEKKEDEQLEEDDEIISVELEEPEM